MKRKVAATFEGGGNMGGNVRRGLEAALAVSALMLALSMAAPGTARAQNLQRFAANALGFGDANEVVAAFNNTTNNPVTFYDNVVKTSASTDVMYVTLSATGDTHGDNAGLVNCAVDGVQCKTGNVGRDGAPLGTGWVVLERNEEDEHDNTVHYVWCVPVKKTNKNLHEVILKFANSADGDVDSVFMEQINVFVDGSHFGDSTQACTNAGTGIP